MQTIPKRKITFLPEDYATLDERIGLHSEQPKHSEQFRIVQKAAAPRRQQTALDLVKGGMNLLEIPPGMIDNTVSDAQFLYSTQMFNDIFVKSLSSVQVPDAYDNLNAALREDDKQAILKDEEFRRAINSISTAWNSLGVYRSDFIKADNDKMARNAYIAMVEKAFLDYIGSVNWDVTDRLTGDRIDYAYDFMCQPNPQGSFRDVFVPAIRDMFRYDAGAIVKTFNRRKELIELKPYLGTEFWIEMDRVPQLISVPTNDNIGIRATEFTSEKTPGKEVLMQGWWSRGYTWRYWQRSQTGVYIPYTPSEVCYLALYKRSDDIYGTDYIKFLKYWIQYLIDSTVAAGKTFQNGMIPSLILQHPNIYDINQIQGRLTQLRFENQGPTRTGTIMNLINGETVQALGQHLHDMEWVEGQKFVAQLVWGYFGFPSDEFIGGNSTGAVAYVHRNVTKSRLLKPMMKYLEDMINREILPYLKGYKKTWQFHFIQEMELDDKQKVAQTGAIRMGSITTGLGAGIPARLAYKIANDEPLSKADLEDLDEAKQNAMMAEMGGMGGDKGNDDILGDQEQGRYGQGSEMYQPVNVSDYKGEGDKADQASRHDENIETRKSELQYEVGKTFYKAGRKYEIISNNGEFAKARIYVRDVKDVPKGRSYKMGARGGIYYIGTLAEKQQGDGNKRTPHGAVEAQPKNGNGGGHGASRAPASASAGQQGKPQIPQQPHDTPFSEEGSEKILEHFKGKLSKDSIDYGEKVSEGTDYEKFLDTDENTPFAIMQALSRKDENPTIIGFKQMSKEKRAEYEKMNENVEKLIDESPPLPEGITLWRGIKGGSWEIEDLYRNVKAGDTIQDDGFQSHTLNPKVAKRFAGIEKIVIRAITNSSTKGIYSDKHGEEEITIQRGTKWKVLNNVPMEGRMNLITVTPA
jgi:hypothetical protein